MPRSSEHVIDTVLTVQLAEVGPDLEYHARLSFTYHPGDPWRYRPNAIDPPEPELIEDVTLEIWIGHDDGGYWRQLKDPVLEAALISRLDEDLKDWAQGDRQPDPDAKREAAE